MKRIAIFVILCATAASAQITPSNIYRMKVQKWVQVTDGISVEGEQLTNESCVAKKDAAVVAVECDAHNCNFMYVGSQEPINLECPSGAVFSGSHEWVQ